MTAEESISYPCELNIFLKTPSGLKGHMKVTEVPSTKAPKLFLQLDAALIEKGFTADSGPSGGARPSGQKPRKADDPVCEDCGTEMEYKTGTTRQGKNKGKQWKGWFCPEDKDHPVQWVE